MTGQANMLFSEDNVKDPLLHRRDVLKIGLVGMLASTIPLFAAGPASAAPLYGAWRVALRHTHTGESFSGVYRVGDKYLPDTFERLNYFLRDFRQNQIFPMDPRVVDIISAIQTKTGAKHMEVLSGYRSPKTNAMLRASTEGVAKNSFHMYGQAIDFRVPGYNTGRLRKVAMDMKAGGVGYYPKSDFVHVDTGKVRHW